MRDQNGQVMGGARLSWVISNRSVATVNASGLVTALGNGTATIRVTAGGVSGTATVTVAQQVRTVEVTPATGIVLPGDTLRLTAEARDANGHAVADSEFSWVSSDTTAAVVDETGLVTGIAVGEVEVSATSSRVTGRTQLEVVEPAPTTVAVRPDTVVFETLGDTLRLTAEVRDQKGRPMPGEAVTWSASDTLVAAVDSTGLVTAVGNGTATITAASGALSGAGAVTVMQVAHTVAVSPAADTVLLGDSLQLAAEALDANGRTVASAEFTWSSSSTSVATVDTSGMVRGVGEGPAEVSATTGDARGVARITVFNPDRAPLVALYNATNGPNWTNNDNWLTDKPLAQWHGVGTDDSGRVTSVILRGRRDAQGNWTRHGLKGTIPAELGNLDKLWRLWLSGNELSGPIPSALGELASLEQLDLSDNELSGRIPRELANLDKLKQLVLHTNSLEHAIPAELASLDSLEVLTIARNELSGPIPAELGHLASLTFLNLLDNELSGPIPSELGGLTSLERLFLGHNELSGRIPSELGQLSSLTQLWLDDNGLSGLIPAALGDLTQLQGLALDGNQLSGSIPPELGNLIRLDRLQLSANRLTGPIPSALGQLSSLTELWLDNNGLSGPIPSTLGDLSNVTDLLLDGNELSGPIPPELGNLASLERLWLKSNGLTGSIPTEFGRLTQLTSLALQHNHLTGSIPSTLGNLGQLTQLDLEENALTGSIPGELGGTSLETLDLRANDLTGPIPPALGSLTRARHLVFSGNNLTGPIPAELGGLHGLAQLDLGGNALTGPVPARLGELTALEELRLEDNELEGTVPSELGALTLLRQFNLTNNSGMTGVLPTELTALTRLEVFLAGGTKLCVPSLPDFETWLSDMYRRRIARCPEASPSTAYLVQVVQSREFPVPLVAGREALLRVFVTARRATREGLPPVRARFYVNDQETYRLDIPGRRSPIPTSVDESRLGRSANAVVPAHVIRAGLEMVIEVDPDGMLDPALGVARRIPETGRLRVDVRNMPLLDLTLIPFLWSENPDSSIVELVREMAADPGQHEMLDLTRTLLPIAGLNVRAHEPVLFPTNNVIEMLSATEAIRAMEGGTGYYKGLMSGKLSGGAGGLAIRPGRSSFSQPDGQTVAHELGHNMSLRHAPCGDPLPTGLDPAFPHESGSIGVWGYDFRERALVDPSRPDVMGYCSPDDWISDFFFSNALRFRLSDYDHPGLPYQGDATRSLLLWGGVGADGSPLLEPAFVVDAPATLPDAAGDHRITGWTADGTELFSLSFAMPEVADGDGSSAFAFTLPVQSSWAGTLARITLAGPGGSAALDDDSGRAVAFVRNSRTGQVRGILRDLPAEGDMQVAAMAAPGGGVALEVLISRGIPETDAWQR